ncbi:hypothetical protein [Pseudonocardia sp. ICBG1293]|uniref:hypothetical protein n=1 Tax=Pseudonocardia sp. ICBG1293 TaxID=2844382 RepID=UPI001CCFA189|nr:hypothetical protein [Pseudonocardia sp. ICBG1293]
MPGPIRELGVLGRAGVSGRDRPGVPRDGERGVPPLPDGLRKRPRRHPVPGDPAARGRRRGVRRQSRTTVDDGRARHRRHGSGVDVHQLGDPVPDHPRPGEQRPPDPRPFQPGVGRGQVAAAAELVPGDGVRHGQDHRTSVRGEQLRDPRAGPVPERVDDEHRRVPRNACGGEHRTDRVTVPDTGVVGSAVVLVPPIAPLLVVSLLHRVVHRAVRDGIADARAVRDSSSAADPDKGG